MKAAALISGIAGVALYLLCFQLKSAKKILACKLFSSVLYVLQYLLLFAFVGAAMDTASLVTTTFAYKKDTKFVIKYKIPILIVLHIAILAIGALLYENLFSLFAIAGVLFESVASWMKKEKMIRVISIFSVIFWLVYNIVSGAYGSAIGSILALISIITALIRYSNHKNAKCNNTAETN